jgi:hypothetical protein
MLEKDVPFSVRSKIFLKNSDPEREVSILHRSEIMGSGFVPSSDPVLVVYRVGLGKPQNIYLGLHIF